MSVVKIQKFDYIDALRGIAIILVIIVHTSQNVPPGNELISRIFYNGDKGVQLFYIVSALTLCFSLDSRKNKESKYILYYFIRRFFRIAPLFYLAILYFQYPYNFEGNIYAPNGIRAWYILSAVTFTHGWHPETINGIVPGSWSIAVEFTFYLALPFLFKIINSKERAILFLIFACLINYFTSAIIHDYWVKFYSKEQLYLVEGLYYHGFFNQLPTFTVGIFLFHVVKENLFTKSKFTSIVLIFFSAFIMFVYTDYCSYNNIVGQLVIYAVAFALLSFALANNRFTFFVNPVTRFTGKISYSMYFIHFAILNFFTRFHFWGLSKYKVVGTLVALIIVFLSTMIIATLTYYLVEKKGIALGSFIIARIENKRLLKNHTQRTNKNP